MRSHRAPRTVTATVCACILAALVVGGCSGTTSTTTKPDGSGTSAPPRTTVTTAPKARTAADDLAEYFAAAEALDRRLAAAATAANGAIGSDQITVTQATLDAIAAADPSAAARAIPAGLTPPVLQAVLTVQSDLETRYRAFRGFSVRGNQIDAPLVIPRDPPVSDGSPTDAAYLLDCLGNGSRAAASFAGDLAAARTVAAQAPPVTPTDPTARPAEELAVRLAHIVLANAGCMSCGGARLTELAPLTWYDTPVVYESGGTPWVGEIGGIQFHSVYAPATGWTVDLNAC